RRSDRKPESCRQRVRVRSASYVQAMRMRRIFLLGMLALSFVSLALAQTADAVIAGSVRDSMTGQPLPDAQLMLMGAESMASVTVSSAAQGVVGQVRTDASGAFRFEKLRPGDYNIILSRQGYVASNLLDARTEHIHAGGAADTENLRLTLTPM